MCQAESTGPEFTCPQAKLCMGFGVLVATRLVELPVKLTHDLFIGMDLGFTVPDKKGEIFSPVTDGRPVTLDLGWHLVSKREWAANINPATVVADIDTLVLGRCVFAGRGGKRLGDPGPVVDQEFIIIAIEVPPVTDGQTIPAFAQPDQAAAGQEPGAVLNRRIRDGGCCLCRGHGEHISFFSTIVDSRQGDNGQKKIFLVLF